MVLILGALVMFSASRQDRNPLAPRVYLDHALSVMRREAIAAPAVNWVAVIRTAHRMVEHAKTPADTYPAIQYVLDQLHQAGDLHAAFVYPLVANATGGQGSSQAPTPEVALVRGRLGQVTLPGLLRTPDSPGARRYVATVLAGIKSLQTHYHPCGWIVDLDGDTGGNAYSMLLSIGPIIGDGRLLGLTGRKGFAYWISYHRGAVSGGGPSIQAPVAVPPIAPAPPVAVLTSHDTSSAGEFVTVAFRGRRQTRSFGAATGGYTNAPELYRLADGAELFFGIYSLVDRNGLVYRHAIAPDVTAYLDQSAAAGWLLSTHACTHTNRSN